MFKEVGILAPQFGYPAFVKFVVPELFSGYNWAGRRHDFALERCQSLIDHGLTYEDFRYWYGDHDKSVNFQFMQKKHAAYFKLKWGGHSGG